MGDKSGVVLAEIVVILILLALTSPRGKALWAVLLGRATVNAPAAPAPTSPLLGPGIPSNINKPGGPFVPILIH